MSNRTTGYWLSGNREQMDNSSLAQSAPSIEEVDNLADELVAEYDNHDYRSWYCKLIYTYGIDRVRLWQERARGGNSPARIFSYYARQAKPATDAVAVTPNPVPPATVRPQPIEHVSTQGATESAKRPGGIEGVLDIVYYPGDEDLTGEGIERAMDESMRMFGIEDPKPQRIDPWGSS